MTSLYCLQVSLFRSEEKCSHLLFYSEIVIIYNIIVLCGFEVLMFFISVDDIYFILWSYCILLYYFILILLWNLMKHRCYSAEVNYWLVNLMKHRYCHAEVVYCMFSSEMENSTLSQICGRLYMPIFLFRVALFSSDVYCFFYGLGNILLLPAFYFEVVHCWCVASSVLMFKKWRWCF